MAADSTNVPTVTPTVVVPFLTHPPTIDGVIAPGEWNTLHQARFVSQNGDLLERHAGEFWIGLRPQDALCRRPLRRPSDDGGIGKIRGAGRQPGRGLRRRHRDLGGQQPRQ